MEAAREDPALSTTGLSVRYRGFRQPPVDALDGLDLRCGRGEVVGVLGPNGSGKTTMFRVLAGTLTPTRGEARVLGMAPDDRRLVERVGYQPEGPLPFPNFRAAEFLEYVAHLTGLGRSTAKSRAAQWIERLGLGDAKGRPIATFSSGMQQRLAVAAALLTDPEVLLLDEPTAGLDPTGSLLVMEVIAERAAAGCAVLMASHHLQEVEQTCDRVYLLSRGRKLAEGSLDELLASGEQHLRLVAPDAAARASVEAAARESGCEVVGWEAGRTHLFELFRRLTGAESETLEQG